MSKLITDEDGFVRFAPLPAQSDPKPLTKEEQDKIMNSVVNSPISQALLEAQRSRKA